MYWRLTSKEKPVKQGKIKVLVAWQGKTMENTEYCLAIYNDDVDKFYTYTKSYSCPFLTPTCWSYIDELPSEEE